MSKIYTKTGDQGDTSLLGGKRVSKDSLRVEAYGTVDELNSCLGAAISFLENEELKKHLKEIQSDLFNLGSELSLTELKKREVFGIHLDWGRRTLALENLIDDFTSELPELRNFILPGGDKGAAFLHLSRSICRRTERKVVALASKEEINPSVLVYLNRLSDLLFTLARFENKIKNIPDQSWTKK